MKKFVVSLLFATCMAMSANASAPPPQLYGYVAEAEAGRQTGFYSITPTAEPEFQLMSKNINANFGGDFIGDVFYCVKAYASWSGVGENVDIESYNTDTWQRIAMRYGKQRNKATDLAYDPTTGTTYGCFFTNDGSGYEYATMDFTTQTRENGVTLGSQYNAVAIDTDGTLYAIDMNGYLYRAIDKEKGVMSAVGNTGVIPRDITSGCIDRRSGRFFWTVRNGDGAFLYEVDKTSGKAEMIAKLPYNERITALCIKTPAVEFDAPDAVTDLRAEFNGGLLAGKVLFTMPSATFGGDELTGNISYKVTDGTNALAEGQAAPGEAVSVDVILPQGGKYEIHAVAFNNAGNGPDTKISLYAGPDTPVAPQPTCAYADGAVTISWQPVTEGINGGYIDPAAVTYKVVRQQDGKIISENSTATSTNDPIQWPSEIVIYNYNVSASCAGLESAATATPKVVLGEIAPPLTETFDNMAALDPYTIIDGNNDRSKWTVGGKMAQVSGSSPMDDWLITPAIRLEYGKIYDFSIDARCYSTYAERMEVKLGTAPEVGAMTEIVIPATDVIKNTMTTFTGRITAPADGLFYIGVRSCGDDPFTLYVDNLMLGVGIMPAAPAAPSDLTAVAAADGSRKVTIRFTAPSVDIDGNDIDALSKAEIYCGETLVSTIDNPAKGAEVTYTHTDAPAGLTTYSVAVWNGAAKGKVAQVEVFVGFNKPVAPEEVTASEYEGKVTLTWQPSTADIDGKHLPADKVTYTVYTRDRDGNPVAVADNISSLTHSWQAVSEGQQYMYLAVAANTEGGSSEATGAPYIPVGKTYLAPYRETFTEGTAFHTHGITHITEGCTWTIFNDSRMQGITSFDSDNGYLAMVGSQAGDAAEIATGKISLSGIKGAALSFRAFNYVSDDLDDDNKVDVSVDCGNGFEPVGTIVLSSLPQAGWNRVITDLSAYDGKTVVIKLRGMVVTYPQTHIDNIRVLPMEDCNLSVSVSDVPERVKSNSSFTITAAVENTGLKPTTPYTVNYFSNDVMIGSSAGKVMQPGEYTCHSIMVSPGVADVPDVVYSAVINLDSDTYSADNTAITKPVEVDVPGYAVPTALCGESTSDGNTLSWTAPDLTMSLPASHTEDFESFTPFGMSGENGWTFADIDGGLVSGIQGTDMPGLPAPGTGTMSWFTLDSGWSGFIANAYKAADGMKYLSNMCLYAGGAVDDRAISPELYGGAQTISFMARSFSAEYPETLCVMISQSGTADEDFTTIATFDRLSSKWLTYYVDLPEGTRRFALCAVSEDAFMLHIDRVEFIPAGAPETLTLKGYNVYRDGQRINNAPISSTTFTDTAPNGLHNYGVSAVYDKGESGLSEQISLETASVSQVVSRVAIVEGGTGIIIIKGAAGLETTVMTVDGRNIARFTAYSDYEEIKVCSGIYIVQVGNTATKVIIR